MVRYTFTCVLEIDPEEDWDTPQEAVDFALAYGHRRQDFWIKSVGEITEEDYTDGS